MRIFVLACLCLLPNIALAQTDYQEVKELDKLSIALTGKPLTRAQINAYVSGEADADSLFDELSQSDDFVDHFAKYWSNVIGIQSMQSISNMLREGTNQTLARSQLIFNNYNLHKDNPDQSVLPRNNPATTYENMRRAIERVEARNVQTLNRSGSIRMLFTTCGGKVMIYSAYLNGGARRDAEKVRDTGAYNNGTPVSLPKMRDFPSLSGTALANARLQRAKDAHIEALRINDLVAVPSCRNYTTHTTSVVPHWDRSGKVEYIATKYLTDARRCGTDLAGCYSDQTRWPYVLGLGDDSTLEPGRIIGRTVAEDQSFKQILTTSKTVMTGRMAHFLNNKVTDAVWASNFPGGKYSETSTKYRNANFEDSGMFWVERGPMHAGVLTTYAYQQITNGRRAKANRAFEAFTCSKFTVPAGAVPDPSDDNPDLRQRKYCAYCHRTLEPMAAFFNRWPDTGRVNYEYDESDDVDDSGLFRGTAGKGIGDYGALLSESASFDTCSVKRAFEFLHGRALTESEAKILVPKYLDVYQSNGNNLREVLRAMIKGREFSEDQSGGEG